MANETFPPGETGQLESLLERWQVSLDLHAGYAALDEERYWHVQPWPKHERPQRWIIQLARKRILALQRIVQQRQAEGDRAFIEGIEIMGFLATLVGLTSVERFIPLATHETERRDVLAARPAPPAARTSQAKPPPLSKTIPGADAPRPRTPPPARERDPASRTAENRKAVEAQSRTGEHKRTAETTRQMPQLPNSKVYRMLAAQRAGVPLKETAPPSQPKREVPRDANRPATIKPKKPGATISPEEHVVIADAVRLLGWGSQWHELADKIAQLSERPAPATIRRVLKAYREHIDAIATRRGG
jgi:hypothetical protein